MELLIGIVLAYSAWLTHGVPQQSLNNVRDNCRSIFPNGWDPNSGNTQLGQIMKKMHSACQGIEGQQSDNLPGRSYNWNSNSGPQSYSKHDKHKHEGKDMEQQMEKMKKMMSHMKFGGHHSYDESNERSQSHVPRQESGWVTEDLGYGGRRMKKEVEYLDDLKSSCDQFIHLDAEALADPSMNSDIQQLMKSTCDEVASMSS